MRGTGIRLRRLGGLVALVLAIAACGGNGGDMEPGLRVVATTTILGDVVANVVGADATVEVLIPTGADPHDYQASTAQVAAVHQADLVVANGLGLEEGLHDALEAAASDGANVLEMAPLVDPIAGRPHDDPHFWLDPMRVADAVRAIGAAMRGIDDSVDWDSRAEAYAQELSDAHDEITRIFDEVPQERRKLVTNHDSFGYFEDQYGFEVIGTVIPGRSTLGDPSSEELAALVRVIVDEDVKAIFAEATEPAVLAEAVAAEVGSDIAVVELFTGSLGEPGSGADTLIGMLRINARRVADALG